MYNEQLVDKVVIWALFGISIWKENVALTDRKLFTQMVDIKGCWINTFWFVCDTNIYIYVVKSWLIIWGVYYM